MCFYSAGLHVSPSGPDHYTSFGFQHEEGALRERWSMHVAEGGLTSSFHRAAGEGQVILWKDIEHLFVCIFFSTQFCFILFFQGPGAT